MGEPVTLKTFEQQTSKLQQKLQVFRSDPKKLCRNRRWLWVLAFSLCGVMLALIFYSIILIDIRFFVLPFIPILVYTLYVKSLQTDLVCFFFASSRNWVYNPDKSKSHWGLLAREFPTLFQKGNIGSQFVENEFWGSVEIDDASYNFWKAPFSFTVGSGKHSRSYTQDAIAFNVPRSVQGSLILTPEGFHLFGEGHDDIKTESVEFNKTFTISCPGMDEVKKQNIVRALSPAVQEKLLDLVKKRGSYSLELRQNVIIFCFARYTSPASYTNFFKKVEIDPRDTEALRQDFRNIVSVTGEMLRYMD